MKMEKLQIIGLLVLVIGIIEINSIKTIEDHLKTSLQAFQAKHTSKIYNKSSKIKEEVLPLDEYSDENIENSGDDDDIQPCTCGIFLSGQFKKKSKSTPKGLPILVHELDVVFPCTPFGIKQCQTKCVEAIIKHMPKSNDILCATVDKDIHKEKAFLFVQNCDTTWYNTKLSAGKEFCCKDNLPYKCPLF